MIVGGKKAERLKGLVKKDEGTQVGTANEPPSTANEQPSTATNNNQPPMNNSTTRIAFKFFFTALLLLCAVIGIIINEDFV